MGKSGVRSYQNTPLNSLNSLKTRNTKYYTQVLLGKEQKIHMAGRAL